MNRSQSPARSETGRLREHLRLAPVASDLKGIDGERRVLLAQIAARNLEMPHPRDAPPEQLARVVLILRQNLAVAPIGDGLVGREHRPPVDEPRDGRRRDAQQRAQRPIVRDDGIDDLQQMGAILEIAQLPLLETQADQGIEPFVLVRRLIVRRVALVGQGPGLTRIASRMVGLLSNAMTTGSEPRA